jgi:hypothetical protein
MPPNAPSHAPKLNTLRAVPPLAHGLLGEQCCTAPPAECRTPCVCCQFAGEHGGRFAGMRCKQARFRPVACGFAGSQTCAALLAARACTAGGEVWTQPALVRGEGAGRRRAASSSGWSANVSEAVRRRTSAWEWLQQSCDSSRRRVSQAALNARAACSASSRGPAACPTHRHRRGSRTRRSRTTPGTCKPANRAAAVLAAVGLSGRKSKSVHSCARPLMCQPPLLTHRVRVGEVVEHGTCLDARHTQADHSVQPQDVGQVGAQHHQALLQALKGADERLVRHVYIKRLCRSTFNVRMHRVILVSCTVCVRWLAIGEPQESKALRLHDPLCFMRAPSSGSISRGLKAAIFPV